MGLWSIVSPPSLEYVKGRRRAPAPEGLINRASLFQRTGSPRLEPPVICVPEVRAFPFVNHTGARALDADHNATGSEPSFRGLARLCLFGV